MEDGETLSDLLEERECVNGECEHCPGLDGYICEAEMTLLNEPSRRRQWQRYITVEYVRKDNTTKSSKDFRLADHPVSVLLDDMRRDLPKLMSHHDTRFKHTRFPRGM